jgi:hypothetical protein
MNQLSRTIGQIFAGIAMVMGILGMVSVLFGETGSVDKTRLATTSAALFALAILFMLAVVVGYLSDILKQLSELNQRDKKMAQWQIKQQRPKQ